MILIARLAPAIFDLHFGCNLLILFDPKRIAFTSK
jgi:hypothetical protein